MSGKTDPDSRLAGTLRTRARSAFVQLLSAFQDADRQARGAYSRGREAAIYPGLVATVLRLVIELLAEARGVVPVFARNSSLGALENDPIPQSVLVNVRELLATGDENRLDFAALDLEHLGTFYEGLMAFDSLDARVHYDISASVDVRQGPSDDRKRLGAHYTSNLITRIVVERSLLPLVEAMVSPDELLGLRLCDPAMGSGAFLLEVNRFLADALVRMWEIRGETKKVCRGEDPILHARRLVARHCLYGVDKNPRAAELARWAIWLSTSSDGNEGVFLDEHIRAGDSLVGRPGGEEWFGPERASKKEKRALEFQKRHRPFHWDTEFAEVFTRGGFDAFVGNPPWVSYAGRAAQPLEDDLRAYYGETNSAFAGYRNLQGLFISRCASMLRSGGRIGFVLPSSMSELGGYGPTRKAHEVWCECDADLPDFGDVFDDVFQPSMALLSTRRNEPIDIESPRLWPLHRADLNPAALHLLERLGAFPHFPPESFGERGFQSMGDDVSHLHVLEAPTIEYSVGVRVGGDVEAFLRKPPKFYCDPAIFGNRFRAVSEWQTVKLFIRQTARFPMVALSDGQAFRNSILAGFSSETWSPFFMLAWLNSWPVRWYHYTRNRDARQGMPQVKIAHLRALPVPRERRFVAPIESLGRLLGERNSGISAAEQKQLDDLVAEALEFGPNDRDLVARWVASMRSK